MNHMHGRGQGDVNPVKTVHRQTGIKCRARGRVRECVVEHARGWTRGRSACGNARARLAEDLRRLREDAGVPQADVARLAGVSPSLSRSWRRVGSSPPSKPMGGWRRRSVLILPLQPVPATDGTTAPGPAPGPDGRADDRRAASALARYRRRWPSGDRFVDGSTSCSTIPPRSSSWRMPLESELRRIEQLVRWNSEKADAIGAGSRLLVVRWTRANRDVVEGARRLLRAAYPADPRDALESLTRTALARPGAPVGEDRPRPSGARRVNHA